MPCCYSARRILPQLRYAAQFQPFDGSAILVIPRDIRQHRIDIFQPVHFVPFAVAPPQVGHIHSGNLQIIHAHSAQSLNGLWDRVQVALVHTHCHPGLKAPAAAYFQSPQRSLLCTRDTAHPIVPAHTVKADLHFWFQSTFFKFVQQFIIDEPAIGIDLVDRHFVRQNAVDQLPQILTDKEFTAGQVHLQNTALCHLVDQIQRLLGGKFSQRPARPIHIAMTAPIIAFAGNRPENTLHIAIVIVSIVLIVIQGPCLCTRLNISLFFTLCQRFLQGIVQQCRVPFGFAVTECQHLKLFLCQHFPAVFRPSDQNPGHPLPSTQCIAGFQSVEHSRLLSLYAY